MKNNHAHYEMQLFNRFPKNFVLRVVTFGLVIVLTQVHVFEKQETTFDKFVLNYSSTL